MPCADAHVIATFPYAGCGNEKVYVELSTGVACVVPTPLIRRSEAFTPETGSLNVTVICPKPKIVPGAGLTLLIVGGTVSLTIDSSEHSNPTSLLFKLL